MIAQTWLNAPNTVTLIRLLLAPAVVVEILEGSHVAAAALFALAAFTDFLDGWVARWTKATTATGQYLDPIADKVLLTSVFVALAIQGSIPGWYVLLVLGRDVAIVLASAIAMTLSNYRDYTPTIWGKISTLLQVLTATVVMAGNALPFAGNREFSSAIISISGVATAWSAVHYTWRGVSFFVRR